MLPKPSPESPPMFETKLFDMFSRTPWFMVPTIHLPLAAFVGYLGWSEHGLSVAHLAMLFVGGWALWSFTEYWAHRTLFHWVPPGKFGEKMHFILHGVHHDWPNDKFRLVFPPALSLSLGFLLFNIFKLLIGNYAYGIYVGFASGYVYYDVMHFYLHWGRPKAKSLKKLKRHHLIHHSPQHGNDNRFGVSTRFWDVVFRTTGRTPAPASSRA